MSITIRNMVLGEGIPKICVPVVGRGAEDILAQAVHAKEAGADMIEWRADFYDSVMDLGEVKKLAAQIRSVLGEVCFLFTFRSVREGGACSVPVYYYDRMIREIAMEKKVDCIDVELFTEGLDLKNFVRGIKETGVRVLLSNHDFNRTPSLQELTGRLYKMKDYGGDLLKIAVMPEKSSDVLALLKVTNDWRDKNPSCPVITMSMSPKGVISRLTGELFGSCLTFANVGKASAPGQIPIEQMKHLLEFFHNNI